MAKRSKPSFASRKQHYTTLFDTCVVTDKRNIMKRVKVLLKNKHRYEKVSKALGGSIPWYVIACIHERESTANFTRHLHNGDSLQGRTHQHPPNRPRKGTPPFTWEESAIDALTMKGLHKIKDWSFERFLYIMEDYNGWGYYWYRRHETPYLWAGTNLYHKGKYASDGKYSSSLVDKQAGCAALLKVLLEVGGELTTQTQVEKSRKFKILDVFRKVFGVVSSTLTGALATSSLDYVKEVYNTLSSFMSTDSIVTLIILGFVFYTVSTVIIKLIEEDVEQGRYISKKAAEEKEEHDTSTT